MDFERIKEKLLSFHHDLQTPFELKFEPLDGSSGTINIYKKEVKLDLDCIYRKSIPKSNEEFEAECFAVLFHEYGHGLSKTLRKSHEKSNDLMETLSFMKPDDPEYKQSILSLLKIEHDEEDIAWKNGSRFAATNDKWRESYMKEYSEFLQNGVEVYFDKVVEEIEKVQHTHFENSLKIYDRMSEVIRKYPEMKNEYSEEMILHKDRLSRLKEAGVEPFSKETRFLAVKNKELGLLSIQSRKIDIDFSL